MATQPILLTPSKAASLADAYQQFLSDPELQGRVAGLTRIECYKLLQELRLFYNLKNEDITLDFLDKVADAKVVLEGEVFNTEHDEKVVKEHDELLEKVEEPQGSRRVVFSSPSRTKIEEITGLAEGAEKPSPVEEIRAWNDQRNHKRLETQLRNQGLSEEQANIYSSVVTTRLNELGLGVSTREEAVREILRETVPGFSAEQIDNVTNVVLNTEAETRSQIGTTLDSFKYSSSPNITRTATTVRETTAQTIARLSVRELPPVQRFVNGVLNQIIPGRREKQAAAAKAALQGGIQEFSTSHPGQQAIVGGLEQAALHPEVLGRIDPSSGTHFYMAGEALPQLSSAESFSTFQFEFNQKNAGGGDITVRSLGRGIPSPAPAPPPASAPDFDLGKGPSLSDAVQTGTHTRDAWRIAASEGGKKFLQGVGRQATALGGRAATSAAPAIAGAMGAIGTGLMGAAGVVGGAIAAGTGAAAATVGAPMLIAIIVGIFIVILVFGFTAISGNQRLYVTEGTPSVAIQSEYIDVVASISPNSYKGDFPKDFQLTIVVTAKKQDLENVKLSETYSVYAKDGNPPSPSAPSNTFPTTLENGKSETITYTLPLDSKYNNAIVTNTITVSADVKDGPKGEKTIMSASTLIGDVPTGCFAFSGGWTEDKRAMVLQAIGTLSKSNALMSRICKGGAPVNLVRSHENKGYGGFKQDNNTIILYPLGVSDRMGTLYTLAHEAGHIVDGRNPDLLRIFPEEIKGEGYLPTYPLGKSLPEDFAETVALYVVYKEMPFGCCGKVNMPKDFFKHYKFAQERIFGNHAY